MTATLERPVRMNASEHYPRYDRDRVKRAANGKWEHLLGTLGNISLEYLSDRQREHPCAKCGNGDTKFRFTNLDGNGSCHCHCCTEIDGGDGFAALMGMNGWDFPTALAAVAEELGVQPDKEQSRRTNSDSSSLEGNQIDPAAFAAEHFSHYENASQDESGTWTADCPCCGEKGKVSGIGYGKAGYRARILKYCYGKGCSPDEIDEKLGVVSFIFADESDSVLEALARLKRVTVDALKVFGAKVEGDWVLFPVYNAEAEQIGTFRIKPNGSKKAQKGLSAKGKKQGLFLPHDSEGKPILPKKGERWLAVEGVKDAAAFWALGYKVLGLPTSNLSLKLCRIFKDVDAVLVPDRDKAGEKGAATSGAYLHGLAASVTVAILPAEFKESKGADVRDCLAREGGEAMVREAIEAAKPWEPAPEQPTEDWRPGIYSGPKEHEVVDQAIKALSRIDGLYQRGGNLVTVVRDPEPPKGIIRPPGSVRFAPLSEHSALDFLSQAARFYSLRMTSDGPEEVDITPPMRVAKIMLARQQWEGIPTLSGVVHAPAFLADGSILATPGYCPQSGLFLAGNTKFPSVPQSPTREDAKAACKDLLETWCDFPFETDNHKAACVAAAITPAARYAFDGPVPLGAIDANVRGGGKTKLADSIGIIHLGDMLPRMSASNDDEEMRKKITSVFLTAEPIVLFDNIDGPVGWPSLDAALTGSSWSDRILGQSKMTGKLPMTTIWLATGNNLIFAADTARRVLHIRLESKEENPEERKDFKHSNLLGWVREHRARLAIAAVTILRAYHVAGRPDMKLPEWGSYEAWSRLIRHAVVWLGMDDPGETRQQVREQSDQEAALLRQMLFAWETADPCRKGLTVSEAIELTWKDDEVGQKLRAAFAEFSTPGKPFSSHRIGMKLHHLKGRVADKRYFSRRTGSGHATYWSVQVADSERGTSGTKGTISPVSYAGTHTHAPARAPAHARTSNSDGPETSSPSPLSPPDDKCDHENQSTWAVNEDGHYCCRACRCELMLEVV